VLWGEVHQDSMHFSEALWQARKTHFLGNDQGRTFDAALYAALVSMSPVTDFNQAAQIIAAHLPAAFPGVQADQKMKAIFDQRGVTNCSKVVDLTGVTEPRTYYGIGGTDQAQLAANALVPGPYQLMLHLPEGARSLTISANAQAARGSTASTVRLLAKVGEPVTFTRVGGALNHDADSSANATLTGNSLTAKATLEVPCGGDLYFTLGSTAAAGDTLQALTATFEKAASCPPDAGVAPDAGNPEPEPAVIASVPENGKAGAGPAPVGCGCNSADVGLSALALFGLVALARRRRQ
jgi:MYXO-CTERM domain-containing protein